MNHPLLGNNYHYDTESGSFVSDKHMRVAEILHDYNPELSLMWIPPASRSAEDTKPYVVVHTQKDGSQYPVFYLSEDELDHRVLARIFAADMKNHRPDDVLVELDAMEAAKEMMQAKEHEDELAEQREFALSLLRTPLHTYRHKGKVYR